MISRCDGDHINQKFDSNFCKFRVFYSSDNPPSKQTLDFNIFQNGEWFFTASGKQRYAGVPMVDDLIHTLQQI
jgi:hypothetical protein